MRDRIVHPVGTFAVTVFGALCVVVMAVGAVAVGAELVGAWSSYFVLEQTVAAATPIATVLLALAIVTGLVAAATTG